jgi:threonine dehydrogenase-like Zn-dependent dehydrogenase
VLAARQLGAERIIAMSRHESRQRLAHEYGATDIVEERGDEGVTRIKELTSGLGAHSVVEAVGTQESSRAGSWSARSASVDEDLVPLVEQRLRGRPSETGWTR